MPSTRDIRTNQVDISCDVCGRTLLRGEQPDTFLAGGSRRQVCELCTVRAQHEGWIRESGADELAPRSARSERRRRGLVERLRSRRARDAAELDGEEAAAQERPIVQIPTGPPERYVESAPPPPPEEPREAPREPRHVRAVPTNAELKMERALEVFNVSEHVRTVGGVARTLGAPAVCVRPLADRPSVVSIAVMWELSWYRYEIDLSEEAHGVRRAAQGDELSELPAEDQVVNAAADERGALVLGSGGNGSA
jgi:hypothetical protein